MKKGQNAGFLRLISSKITPTKEKETFLRRKRKNEEDERRRKKAKVALLVFMMATV